ncbi:hypothetical protein FKG94_28245 [Exilibacterium tricleocarpae]|uniref:Uncharacterized protein n=1 Tax=Exilibacterium tricleocarpae TaxID=2591008 RepID=A0A545SL36_9GAMM|nr:hypothetical protein [Exilibacterium tricleocarpae]TQV65693.1 hypothetical protein FKG94_28245 [Exilibacterium tricleocarpae]
MKKIFLFSILILTSSIAWSWDAKVTNILHHRDWVAVSFSPDPGNLGCSAGSPYLLKVDETAASQQRFSIILTALASGKTIGGHSDGCSSAIWGTSRPVIERINLRQN